MRKLFLIFTLAGICLLFFSACTGTANQNVNTNANANINANIAQTAPANAAPAATPPSTANSKARWQVAVCSARAGEVVLQAGPSKDDSATFATWQSSSTQRVYNLPERVQNLTKVYVQAIGSESQPVELCVLYDNHPKKRIDFEDGSEDETVSSSDDDDNDCRCVK